jgi:hypothetical protein
MQAEWKTDLITDRRKGKKTVQTKVQKGKQTGRLKPKRQTGRKQTEEDFILPKDANT